MTETYPHYSQRYDARARDRSDDGARDQAQNQAKDFKRTATRADLLDAVSSTCPGLSRHQAREVFESTLEEVSGALTRGESVKIRSFGLFSVREKRERIGRNPRTGEEVPITPRRVLTFKPSPVLLDQVNGRDPGRQADEDD